MSGLRGFVVLLLAMTGVAHAAQDIDAAALAAAIDKARSEQVDALAPTNFEAVIEFSKKRQLPLKAARPTR